MSKKSKDGRPQLDLSSFSDGEFEKRMTLLNFYQDEFKMRQEHFWKTMIRLCLVVTALALIPFVSEVGGIVLKGEGDPLSVMNSTRIFGIEMRSLAVFPSVGIIIALLSIFLLFGESKRLVSVAESARTITRSFYTEKETVKKKKGPKWVQTLFGHMSHRLAIFVPLVETLICVCSILAVTNMK